jgi:hypothetical protein
MARIELNEKSDFFGKIYNSMNSKQLMPRQLGPQIGFRAFANPLKAAKPAMSTEIPG